MDRTVFHDPDEFLDTFNVWGADMRIVTGRAPFRCGIAADSVGALSRIDVEISPKILFDVGGERRATGLNFAFMAEGSPPYLHIGTEITRNDIWIWHPTANLCTRFPESAPTFSSCITAPDAEIAKLFDEPFGNDLVRPSPQAMQRLRRAYRSATHQDDLMGAIVECLVGTPRARDGNPARTILRLQQLVRRNWSLPLDEICGRLGVTERTLRRYCDAVLGMGPHEYKNQARLDAVRRTLAGSDPATTKITEVAEAYGFSHLSRFSRDYRRKFDELPSDTLWGHRRPPVARV